MDGARWILCMKMMAMHLRKLNSSSDLGNVPNVRNYTQQPASTYEQ